MKWSARGREESPFVPRVPQGTCFGNSFGYREAGPRVEEESRAPPFARRERWAARQFLWKYAAVLVTLTISLDLTE